MKAKEIRDLINFISNSGLDEVNIETEEIKLSVKRHGEPNVRYVEAAQPTIVQQPMAAAPQPAPQPAQVATEPAEQPAESTDSNLVAIKAPMIGTFYRSPSPEAESFVNVGDTVKKGDVVCIVEAMKLFNEIESEVSGKIVKALVDNASPVEYDQPLFLIEPTA